MRSLLCSLWSRDTGLTSSRVAPSSSRVAPAPLKIQQVELRGHSLGVQFPPLMPWHFLCHWTWNYILLNTESALASDVLTGIFLLPLSFACPSFPVSPSLGLKALLPLAQNYCGLDHFLRTPLVIGLTMIWGHWLPSFIWYPIDWDFC